MELMQHQIDGLTFLRNKQGAALFFEPGLGKTLTILSHLQWLIEHQHQIFPVLIIAPLSVLSVWEIESKKFNFGFTFKILHGTKSERIQALNSNSDIYVINYEGTRILKKELNEKKFKTFIADESHRLKSRGALQTQACTEIAHNCRYKYILTGTPVVKSPEDLWSQIQLISPGIIGNFYSFQAKYVEFKKIKIRSQFGMKEIQLPHRFKNLSHLQVLLDSVSLRKTAEECLDLPEKIYKKIPCYMSGEQLKHYNQIKFNLQTEVDNQTLTYRSALTQLQKLQQVCQGFLYVEGEKAVRFPTNAKFEVLKDLLEDLWDKKIILFCNFIDDAYFLKEQIIKMKREFLLFDGTSDERKEIVEKFQSMESPCILISSIDKAKEGITLTAASQVIYYGNTYNYASRYQSEARAHRTGQKKNVVYYDLYCPRTVDERVLDILQLKKETADRILGDSMRLALLTLSEGELNDN